MALAFTPPLRSAALAPRFGWLRSVALGLLMLGMQAACVSFGPPTERELAAIENEGKTIVLLRLQCTLAGMSLESTWDGSTCPVFRRSTWSDGDVSLGLASFETGGLPMLTRNRFMSDESSRAGWTFLVLSPGTYYLAIPSGAVGGQKPYDVSRYSIGTAPTTRWRVDVPEGAGFVYVGTFRFHADMGRPVFFARRVITAIDVDTEIVADERQLAEQLVAEHFPKVGAVTTALAQRWHAGEPIILRSPVTEKG